MKQVEQRVSICVSRAFLIKCWSLPPSEKRSESQSRQKNSSSLPLYSFHSLVQKCSHAELTLAAVTVKFKASWIISKITLTFLYVYHTIYCFCSTWARFMRVSLKCPEVSESISCWRSLLYSRLKQKCVM